MTYAVGDVILNRYEVDQALGEGGFGEVYRVKDRHKNNAVVALKYLSIDKSQVDNRVLQHEGARFRDEFRALTTLSSEYVVKGFDLHEEDLPDRLNLYMTIEYLPGGTLADRLGGPMGGITLDEGEAKRILSHVGLGLKVAHECPQGCIIHRDIKPQNVMFDAGGTAKLVDFGIARFLGEKGRTLTSASMPFTPMWAAPELIQDRRQFIGPWTDVWSVGVLLYQMVSGQLPFVGDSTLDIMIKIVQEAHPPLTGVSPEIVRVVDTCLRKEPSQRYQNMYDLLRDLGVSIGVPCPRCGTLNPPGSRFCIRDGEPLPGVPEKPEGPPIRCPRCGADNPPGSTFCMRDGYRLDKELMGRLQVVDGPGLGFYIDIVEDMAQTQRKYRIGRRHDSVQNDLAIEDHRRIISREHAFVYRDGHTFYVEDRDSQHGTYVDNVLYKNRAAELSDGCIVVMGATKFRFQVL